VNPRRPARALSRPWPIRVRPARPARSRSPRDAAPQRRHELHSHAVRAADRDDSLRAVHRRPGEHSSRRRSSPAILTRSRWPRPIRPTSNHRRNHGFFRAKDAIDHRAARALVADHGGEFRRAWRALVALPGVGRKTANVVLATRSACPGSPSIVTSCEWQPPRHRVSNDRRSSEKQLQKALQRRRWTVSSDT